MPTQKPFSQKETRNGISAKTPKCISTESKKAVKALTRASFTSDMNECRDMTVYYFKASGKFDAAVCKLENKPAADKTWINIKTFIATEYAHENKQNKLTAKQFKANLIKEQADAMEELITTLTENHTRKMETLIKNMTYAMKEMMQLIKSNATTLMNPIKLSDEEKKKKHYGPCLHSLW